MGCTIGKLDKNICERDETPKMHSKYMKKNGIEAYNALMVMKNDCGKPIMNDH